VKRAQFLTSVLLHRVGSVIYLHGGNGLPEDAVNSDPDNRLELQSKLLNDFYMLDLDTAEKKYIVDLHDKKSKKPTVLSTKRVGHMIKVHPDQLTCETLVENDPDEDSEASVRLSVIIHFEGEKKNNNLISLFAEYSSKRTFCGGRWIWLFRDFDCAIWYQGVRTFFRVNYQSLIDIDLVLLHSE